MKPKMRLSDNNTLLYNFVNVFTFKQSLGYWHGVMPLSKESCKRSHSLDSIGCYLTKMGFFRLVKLKNDLNAT